MIRSSFKPKHPMRQAKQYHGDQAGIPPLPYSRFLSSEDVCVPDPKEAPVRSESYRRFVASHPCFDCGIEGFSQCAHENLGKGLSIKACDLRTFPLCAPHFGMLGCHQEFDLGLGLSRDERREQGARWVERMQAIARTAGRTEFA